MASWSVWNPQGHYLIHIVSSGAGNISLWGNSSILDSTLSSQVQKWPSWLSCNITGMLKQLNELIAPWFEYLHLDYLTLNQEYREISKTNTLFLLVPKVSVWCFNFLFILAHCWRGNLPKCYCVFVQLSIKTKLNFYDQLSAQWVLNCQSSLILK